MVILNLIFNEGGPNSILISRQNLVDFLENQSIVHFMLFMNYNSILTDANTHYTQFRLTGETVGHVLEAIIEYKLFQIIIGNQTGNGTILHH